MNKREREIIEEIAKYATQHQHENVCLIDIAYALWQLSKNKLDSAHLHYLKEIRDKTTIYKP